MDFGIFIPQGWRLDLVGIEPARQWPLIKELAQRADAGPWSSLWVYDHFHTVPVPTDEATHEAWSLMAGIAASTQRIRLGQMCTSMAYRNPAYLAKVATTVDHISGGRVEMGIGAGWYEHEWRAYGYGFPSAGERLRALDEGVQIFIQAWRDGISTLAGDIYQVDGAINRPLPLQENGIPLWIAGGGEKKTLRIAAQYAQFTNFDGTPEGFAHKSEILAKHASDFGRDLDEITRSANYNVVIGETAKDVADKLDWIEAHYASAVAPEIATSYSENYHNGYLVGTVEQIIERLHTLEELGLGYAIANFADVAYDRSAAELFEQKVIPEFS